jgi:hypothetical protein
MNKGQVFSTDMLIGMVLILLGIGFLGSLMEFNLYNTKQQYNINEFNQKTETAVLTLVNSPWSACYVDGVFLPYSISPAKLKTIGSAGIKQRLGLSDYNVNITIGSGFGTEVIIGDAPNGAQVGAIDLNIIVCHKSAGFGDLNKCMRNGTSCENDKTDYNILFVKVSK